MTAPSGPNLSAFPSSPYAAELQRGAASRSFSPAFEAEYVRTSLASKRTLIRAACSLAVLVAATRVTERVLEGSLDRIDLVQVALVIGASLVLAAVAWSRAFERLYLALARVIVPIRNCVAAVTVVETAAQAQVEALMLLPLMVVGPFFFLGLSVRDALLTVVLTVASFVVGAAAFDLALPVALRAFVFLVMAAAACAIAAHHLERWSRTSFLEGRVIAELAQHDALTGLKNRRVFDEHLERLWRQGIEDDRVLAIMLIDVDHFKEYNDLYGHQAGDQTLRRVAQTLHTFLSRPLDVLARYGGEEFAAILYDVDGGEAEALAERMRLAVCGLDIEHRASRAGNAVTISVGVALIAPSEERRSRGALQLADEALYEAKVRGRNRVEVLDQAAHRLLVTGVFSKMPAQRGRS